MHNISSLREAWSPSAPVIFRSKRFSGMRMKSAALFAIGFLSVGFWLPDSAKCQTSLAPPLCSRPAPSPDVMRHLRRSSGLCRRRRPTTLLHRRRPPGARRRRRTGFAANGDGRRSSTKAAARRAAPPVAARDAPSPKPAADHDGFTTQVEDGPVAKLPVRPRAANRPKPKKEANSIAGQPWTHSPEDEQLKRKLTICRDCK